MRKNSKLKFLKLIIPVIISIFLISCSEENQNDSFFLGGEIINPSSSYVNFYYNNIKIDSIQLDSQNKFFKKIQDIKPGIYRIEHVPENQNIIVENGDSLWIRVNVEDFIVAGNHTTKWQAEKQRNARNYTHGEAGNWFIYPMWRTFCPKTGLFR